jgi:flagellar M-ring protein FliF
MGNSANAMEGLAMDVIRQQFARIQEQFAALTASQRMLAVSLVVIMVMTLLWWAKYAGTSETEPVSPVAMTTDELTAAKLSLDTSNIPNVVSGSNILVAADRKISAIATLAAARVLPRDGDRGFQEIISGINAFDSESNKAKLWNVALQHNLEQIICNMPGVQSCKVLIDPTAREHVEGSVRPSASVSVNLRPPNKPERKLAEAIGYLVSGSNAQLSQSRVNVVIDRKVFPLQDRSEDDLASAGDTSDRQAAYEQYNESKISKALQGYGDVVATVRAKIDMVSQKTTEKTITAVKSVETKSETTNTESSQPIPGGGEPGAGANTGASLAPIASAERGTTTEEHVKSEMQNFPSEKLSNTNKPAGEPMVLSAAVHIPHGYFVDLARHAAGADAKEPDEKTVEALFEAQRPKIAQIVMKTVGLQDEKDVVIDASPDALPMMAAIAPETVSTSGTVARTVFSHAREITLGALALVSLFMVSTMVKKGAPAPAFVGPAEKVEPALLGNGEVIAGEVGEGNPMLDGMELDDDSIRAQQMVEQVSTLVEENPDAAANLVKRWLNRS